MSRTTITAQQAWARLSASQDGPRYEVRCRDGLGDFWRLCTPSSRVVRRADQWDRHLSYKLAGEHKHIGDMARPGNFRIAKGRR